MSELTRAGEAVHLVRGEMRAGSAATLGHMNTSMRAPGSGLTRAGGILMIVIAVVHVVFTSSPYWPGWLGL